MRRTLSGDDEREFLKRMIPDKLEEVGDSLIVFRLLKASVNLGLLSVAKSIDLIQEPNSPINDVNFSIAGPEGEAFTTPAKPILYSHRLPGGSQPDGEGIFSFTAGMEFDLEAQREFEDTLLETYHDLFYHDRPANEEPAAGGAAAGRFRLTKTVAGGGIQIFKTPWRAIEHLLPDADDDDVENIADGVDAGDKPEDNLSLARSLLARIKAISDKKNELADKGVNKLAEKQFSKLMDEYAYTEYRAEIQVKAKNLKTGAEEAKSFTEIIRKRRVFDATSQAFQSGYKHEKTTEGNVPVVVMPDCNILDVRFSLKRNTGVRELVQEGLEAYEEAAPLEKAGAGQYGELGGKAGAFLDKAVLKYLEKRFLSEEQIIPDGKFKLLFHHDLPEAVRRQYEAESDLTVLPLKMGSIVAMLGAIAVPLLTITKEGQ